MKKQSPEVHEELLQAFHDWHNEHPGWGVTLLLLAFIIPLAFIFAFSPQEEIGPKIGLAVGVVVIFIRVVFIPICHSYAKYSPRHRRRVFRRKSVH